ncbi:MAG: DUF3604 domain-containing protein [bacterium]|nr:DUF3604 domain-containing protein [bacterium]
MPGPIAMELMGEVWPVAEPGADPGDRGRASLECREPVEIRSFQTLRLTYTVGRFGLDDTGGIKVVQRFANDGGRWQTDDPAAMNYCTARASNGCRLVTRVEPGGHQRPWDRSLRIIVTHGSMTCGDRIEVVFGDRSGGSPGLRMQTFTESAHEFRVLVDACATGHFLPVPDRPFVTVVPGNAVSWHVVLPTRRHPGSTFALSIRAEDVWSNPSGKVTGPFHLAATGAITGLPSVIDWPPGDEFLRIEGLSCPAEGVVVVRLLSLDGQLLATSNPLVVEAGVPETFWGDLHGQSGETVGINTIEEYFSFARDRAFLDVTSHQANDFQINDQFWQRINDVAATFNEDGRFVTFPGYEWSGNTSMGGDHNVFFRHEGRAIRRSSHALLHERAGLSSDVNTSSELFEALRDEDCVVFAHIGGRPADIAAADGGALRTAVEIHSNWGTFEWLMAENFALGYRHGLVCNSDVHKGRPGASHPGASEFGAYGGLTCFLADHLNRDGIFRSLRRRHHYGTTGCRLHMDVRVMLDEPASRFDTDPRLGPVEPCPAVTLLMGDIASTARTVARLHLDVATRSPILRIDILNGASVVASLPGYRSDATDTRLRVLFHGAEYRGRGRQTRWRGRARFDGSVIGSFSTVCAWNHERPLLRHGKSDVVFDVLTTGNFVGFDAGLESWSGHLALDAGHVDIAMPLQDIGEEPLVVDAGGLERHVSLTRLPEGLTVTRMTETLDVALHDDGDNPLWIRVTTEDGHRAWSSPVYLFRQAGP